MRFTPALLAIAVALLPVAVPVSLAQGGDAVNVVVDKEGINFFVGKRLVTRYLTKNDLARPVFLPLHAPSGTTVTRAWPLGDKLVDEVTDHPHHHSAWFCYGDVIPEGVELKANLKGIEGVDFWSISKGHGKIVCTKIGEAKAIDGIASITTQNEWQQTDGSKVMDEVRKLHFVSLPKGQLIVLEIDLHASVCPITFGDTKEGAMAIRIHPLITGKSKNGKIQNAEGKVGESQCWGQKSGWCDYSGTIADKVVGLAVFDDPKNPHPSCWHARDYGLMAANPFGRQKAKFPGNGDLKDRVKLDKGQHLMLRYALYVHDGDAVEGQVQAAFDRFVKLRAPQK